MGMAFAQEIDAVFTRLSEQVTLAQRFGPFFFGVFLVLIAIFLLLRDRRAFAAFFGLFGITFMVYATVAWSRLNVDANYVYMMRIELGKEHEIFPLSNDPPLYHSGKVAGEGGAYYYYDLIAVSKAKLENTKRFRVFVRETRREVRSDGESALFPVEGEASFAPILGGALNIFRLRGVDAGEDSGRIFEIQPVESAEAADTVEHARFFNRALASTVTNSYRDGDHVGDELSGSNASMLVQLDTMRTSVEAKMPDTGVQVIYYERDADSGRVREALDELGISYFVRRGKASDVPSNALWIGRDVPDDLARGVAFGLLENGVMLKYFGPFTYTDSKVNVIEIGYSVSNAERSTYVDVEDVIAVTNTKASSDRLSGYRVYVHRRSAVGNDYPGDETIRQKLEALGAEVVGFDDQADPFGPGVDYMRGASDAKQAAEALAMIVNEVIAPNDEPSEPLRARAQSSLPQADLLGLWF